MVKYCPGTGLEVTVVGQDTIYTTLARPQRLRRSRVADDPPCALYVIVSDDNRRAKIGLVETPNAARRRRTAVQRACAKKGDLRGYRLALVAEIEGLAYTDDNEAQWAQINYLSQAFESAVRMVLTTKTRGYDEAYEWLLLDGNPRGNKWWENRMQQAWAEVLQIAPPWVDP